MSKGKPSDGPSADDDDALLAAYLAKAEAGDQKASELLKAHGFGLGNTQGSSPLLKVLKGAQKESGLSMGDLTVLSAQIDPYRLDTPPNHRDGSWFARQFSLAIGSRAKLHLRGIHYAIVARGDVVKPNGKPYINSEPDWLWLQNRAAKAARWLGYVPFDKIEDRRNDDPVIRRQAYIEPTSSVSHGLDIDFPDGDDLKPTVEVEDFYGRQPYHLVIYGEKSSLSEVLDPICQRCRAVS